MFDSYMTIALNFL